MGWYNGYQRFPHEVDEGLLNPWGEDDVRKQGDDKVQRAFAPFTRPPNEELQDEGFGWPELEECGGEA